MKILSLNKTSLLINVCILLLGSYFLFTGGLSLEASRSSKALWNLGHVVYFAFLTLLFFKLKIGSKVSHLALNFYVLCGSIFLGTLIEILQYGTARNTDVYDIAHDALGTLIVLAFYKKRLTDTNNKNNSLFKALVIILSLISLWPLSIAITDELTAQSQFPILSNFSTPLEINRWKGSAHFSIGNAPLSLKPSLRIMFSQKKYSGVRLTYFEPNWSGFSQLSIELSNPSAQSKIITIRVHDLLHKTNYRYSDRYNQKFKLTPGLNQVLIPIRDIEHAPKTRLMDIKNIIDLNVFNAKSTHIDVLYINKIALLP